MTPAEIGVPPHPWCQEDFYDSHRVPWTYNADTGVLMSTRRIGEGDGMYVYAADESVPDGIGIVPNPQRGDVDNRYRQRMCEMFDRLMELVAADTSADLHASTCSSSSSSEDDEDESDGTEDVEVSRPRAGARRRSTASTDIGLEGCEIISRSRPGSARCDLKITTPDGRTFRSKIAALRYLEDL